MEQRVGGVVQGAMNPISTPCLLLCCVDLLSGGTTIVTILAEDFGLG